MSTRHRPLVRSLLLTSAFALALGVPAEGQQAKPGKPPRVEEPAPKPPAEEPEPEEKPEDAQPSEEEPAPAEEPEPEEKPEDAQPSEEETAPAEEPEPEEKPAEEAKPEKKPEPGALDNEAVEAVIEMSKRLAELESFTVEATLVFEEVLENGEKILSVDQVKADVARPYGLRMERTSPGRERILFYNGETVALWGPVTRYYAAAPFKGRLAELATHLAEQYGYEIPLADLFTWGHDEAQIKAIEAANIVDQDRIGGRLCDHYAFRQEGVDWQIWIDTAEEGLPCAYAITDLSDPARPLFQATLKIRPEDGFYDRRFTFDPPEDAAEIPLATTRPQRRKTAPEPEAAPKAEEPESEEPAAEPKKLPETEEPHPPEETPKEGKVPQTSQPGTPDRNAPKKEQ